MNLQDVVAIDVHTHAMVSTRNPPDLVAIEFDNAMAQYFKQAMPKPTISETAAYYRARKMMAVIFTVDTESATGQVRIRNEEIAEEAAANRDVLIPFASIDPRRGKMAAREAKTLITEYGVQGFKFHPSLQAFFPNDRCAYDLYEVIAEYALPAIFHSGQTGAGAGMRAGGGIRLKYSDPIYLDDVAVDFPDMKIVIAHPSFPWQENALAVATHKPNVYIDLSGWSPKYFPPILIQYINGLLKNKMLFASDFPVITPDRWMEDFEGLPIKPEVKPLVLKENAIRLLGLDREGELGVYRRLQPPSQRDGDCC
ncbi:amidohydrolase family protein [Burkholderia ubonensis]|uniref:amidohydrolase family protein n=1 Tax=Burkholderia ubonensis TaxID=101571 RepID=UPI000BA5461E|nr:amidohydrolase family protein [Burkholderia ubonensis]PAJ85341.1 4-hydroxyphenyl-beta-ketoacyl-CoA hydrolase [Burkholderia ubonensis]PAJ92287.1 4-hydroxyphenyl-beta-ketoacyl-CoA hydrolase [Burkholderia ubonensis]PAK05643.1 4-hydroxyphenyl-beta-ketoacyl-CoA hydrolase [Burkholderia ubonensis]RQP67675.1 amidohydrolase [Burkholderia ubonensis]RQP84787.1 amidohydrolase [Burkholderia ubonensis]